MINRTKRILKRWKCVCLAARLDGDVRPAAPLPRAAQTGDQRCRLGRAGMGWAGLAGRWRGGRERERRRGDPAGVWLRSNPGDYYRWDTHTHTHTLALVFVAGVSPDSCGFPRSEVITRSAILHAELRYHSGCRINGLSSLCEHCFKA